MQIHDIQQSSPEWHALRARHFCASEAAAMLGLSPYTSRDELLRMKATGDEREYSEWVRINILEKGHEIEANARPKVEAMFQQDLYPTVGTAEIHGLPLLASFDGLTMDGETSWEGKSKNSELQAQIEAKALHPHYWAQLEHQLLVGGHQRAYFTAGDGDTDVRAGLWYESRPERRQQIIAGWKLFAEDLANYQPVERKPAPVGEAISDLPALTVEISGQVVASNLHAWREVVLQRIDAINRTLTTDQHFADAEQMVKFLDAGERRIALVKSQAQAQATSIDELYRALDDVSAKMKTVRLELNRLVTNRKDEVRVEIVMRRKDALNEHVAHLNARIGRSCMPSIAADFAAAMKGKKTVKSLEDAADAELARVKIEANAIADRIQINLKALADAGEEYTSLFADWKTICTKAEDDFAALVKSRIADHKEREARRMEAERERIRREEEAKARAEVEAKLRAEQATQRATVPAVPAPSAPVVQRAAPPVAMVQTVPMPPNDGPAKTIKLGDICTRLGFTVTADVLASLGFPPAETEKSAKLYREADFRNICMALIRHIAAAGDIDLRMAA